MNASKESSSRSASAQPAAASRQVDAFSPVLAAQRIGNHNLYAMLRSRQLQAKLTVSDPNDAFEQEADRVADQVMRFAGSGPASFPPVQSRTSDVRDINRSCGCEGGGEAVDDATEATIRGLPGRGALLPDSVRSFMEPRFNVDFSAVRVHTDAHAHQLARAVSAQAFTVGNDIVFGAGHYAPNTESGNRLLAHELTHVVQQSGRSTSHTLHRQPLLSSRFHGAPEDVELNIVDIKDIEEFVHMMFDKPGPAVAKGRAEYRANYDGAMRSIYSMNFRSDAERLSYAIGVFREFLGGEAADRDWLYSYVRDYEETYRRRHSDLVVHDPPTPSEAKRLAELRSGVRQRANERRAREREAELGKLKRVDSDVSPEQLSPLGSLDERRDPSGISWYVELEPASPIIAVGTQISFHLRNGSDLEGPIWAELTPGAGPHPLLILSDAEGHFSFGRTKTIKPYHSVYRTTLDKPGRYRATFLARPKDSSSRDEVRVSVDFQVLPDLSPERVAKSLNATAASDLEHLNSSHTSEGEVAEAFRRIAVRRAFEVLEANRQEALQQLALYTNGSDGKTAQKATEELESVAKLDFMLKAKDSAIINDPQRMGMQLLTHEQQVAKIEHEHAQRQAIANARATLVEAFPALALVDRHGESQWLNWTGAGERLAIIQSGLRQVLADIETAKRQLATGELSILRATPILAQTRQSLGITADSFAAKAIDKFIQHHASAEQMNDLKIGAASLALLLIPGIGPYLAAVAGIGFATRSWMRVGELKAGAGAGVREGIVARADLENATFWATIDSFFAVLDAAGPLHDAFVAAKGVAPHVRPAVAPLAEKSAKRTATEVRLGEAERPHAPPEPKTTTEVSTIKLGRGAAKLVDLPTFGVTLGGQKHTIIFGQLGKRVGAMLCSSCGFIIDRARVLLRELDPGSELREELQRLIDVTHQVDGWVTKAIRAPGEHTAEAHQQVATLLEVLKRIEGKAPPALLQRLLPELESFEPTAVEAFPQGGSPDVRSGSKIRSSEHEPAIPESHIPNRPHAPDRQVPRDAPSVEIDSEYWDDIPTVKMKVPTEKEFLASIVDRARKKLAPDIPEHELRGIPRDQAHFYQRCMERKCGQSRMLVARELTKDGISDSKIFMVQVADITHYGKHTFTVVEIAPQRYILIDATFAQFEGVFNGVPRVGERIMRETGEIGRRIRTDLLYHGYIELNDEIANIYVKIVAELDAGNYTVRDLIRPEWRLDRNRDLLDGLP